MAKTIEDYKQDYAAAQAAGDRAGMDAAHAGAEAIRAQSGYSGGVDGSQYISLPSGGVLYGSNSSGSTDPYAGTDYHADAIKAAQAGDWGTVLSALNSRNQKVAATGNDYGKSSNDILQELYAQYGMPENNGSQWDSVRDNAASQLLNMSYEDWLKSDEYAALRDRYNTLGQMGMQNVLGQISGRTGGMASSYATTAAQQQYNEYLAQLEEVARGMYGEERSDLMENFNVAQSLAQDDYSRYMDEVNQYYKDREWIYGVNRDNIADERYETENAKNEAEQTQADARDRIAVHLAANGSLADLDPELITASGYTQAELEAQEQYYAGLRADNEQASADEKAAAAQADARERIAAYLIARGKLADLDPDLITASGYTQAELAALEQYYANNENSTGGTKTTKKPNLTAAQVIEALAEGIVNETTLAAYEYYFGEPWEDEKEEETTVTPTSGYGPSYSTAWQQARKMYDNGASDEEIMAYLDRFSEDRLTDAGLTYIMNSLNLGGFRE